MIALEFGIKVQQLTRPFMDLSLHWVRCAVIDAITGGVNDISPQQRKYSGVGDSRYLSSQVADESEGNRGSASCGVKEELQAKRVVSARRYMISSCKR